MNSLSLAPRRRLAPVLAVCLLLPVSTGTARAGASTNPPPAIPRHIPRPLPDHPGNIFLAGESVSVVAPDHLPATGGSWRLLDEEDRPVEILGGNRTGWKPGGRLALGELPVGYYRLEFLAADGELLEWTAAGVLAPLRAPVPFDSPVGVDAAIAWFAADDPVNQRRHARFAALAGVNWIRDRLRWRDLEPARGRFAGETSYDTAATIQHEEGLQVLQVFHDTPPWARDGGSGGEFAPDLRDVHRLGAALARRFKGRVQAWEPWNEANVATFGGHTVDQMCAWQKAAWLGFKAGDPGVIVGWNVTTTVPTEQQTAGLAANDTAPFYDTYNIHTYDWAHAYAGLWGPAREAAGGKPIWITESDRGFKHLGNAPWNDLSRTGERLKAEYVTQSYAQSLFAGADRHFHFILGDYHEPSGVQFGLLRRDFTPRPAYLALAAVGRFLAGAECLGRWRPGPDITVVAFRGRPDGESCDVLVAWAEKDVDWPQRGTTVADLRLPEGVVPRAVFDFLGRPAAGISPLGSAPRFILLPAGLAERVPLEPRPLPASVGPNRESTTRFSRPAPFPVVLQARLPASRKVKVVDRPWSEGYAYRFVPGETVEVPIRIYNFGDKTLTGCLRADPAGTGWSVAAPAPTFAIGPGDQLAVAVRVTFGANEGDGPGCADGWLSLLAQMGYEGSSRLALRFVVPKEQ
ncbi:MAG: hypothetical protein H7A45_13975 [Verrucomicrobiales bacterium]|nr:hypothetical protein [Verrucomicrobiales bacterium]MCP5527324.1 hypothetical protein [Verrucomicrobiales bacterium]